jgi:hypothetical protein
MRQASADDIGVLDAIAHRAGQPSLPTGVLDTCIVCLGEHGFVIADPMDEALVSIHVTLDPEGRGKWGKEFFGDCLRWLFTHTRVEGMVAQIPAKDKHVVAFAVDSWFHVVCRTEKFTYVGMDLLWWLSNDPGCATEADESDYLFYDQKLVARVHGVCKMMEEAGMPAKAWYIHNLYAKLFGYKAEV